MRSAFVRVLLVAAALVSLAGYPMPASALGTTPVGATPVSAAAEKASQDEPVTAATVEPTLNPPSRAARWQGDGVISAGEYARSASAGRMTVYWVHDDSFLYIALQARSSGWLSIGFDPDRTY